MQPGRAPEIRHLTAAPRHRLAEDYKTGTCTTAAGKATLGEPGAQKKRSVVANTALAVPAVDKELRKCYLLAVPGGGCGERRQ